MTKASKIIKVAKQYLGCNESDGSFRKIIDIYNSHKPLARGYALKYSDEWCDGFVSAVAIECGAVDLIGTEVGVERHRQICKNKGTWIGRVVPKTGDIVFYDFDQDGWADHIGIVVLGGKDHITTIEGNYNESVSYNYPIYNQASIMGYARPLYEAEEKPTPVRKQILHLHEDQDRWRVYDLNVAPVVGNEKGFLLPSRFGGLDYEILGWAIKDTAAIIQTRDFGKVQIYVADSGCHID